MIDYSGLVYLVLISLIRVFLLLVEDDEDLTTGMRMYDVDILNLPKMKT